MSLFLKKGVNKKKGDYIYPEPTQTKTGNCAAYAGAACLYAFGLDHEEDLIPDVNDGTPGEQFQVKMQRMVERLTDLIYTQKNSVAKGYKKYLEETGLDDKFEVTEFSGEGSYTLPDGSKKSNWEFALEELKRCQDIIPFIKWDVKDEKKKEARHAVTLVGIDEAAGEAIIANPWGKPSGTTNVPPDEAGPNTEAGQSNRAHTRYKFKKEGDKITLELEGNKAVLYNFVMICPVQQKAAMVISQAPQKITQPNGLITERYSYDIQNIKSEPVNIVAIELPGIQAIDIVQMQAPKGWSSSIWYRDREPYFDLLGPEMPDPEPNTFAGVIWNTQNKFIKPDQELGPFSFDLKKPVFDINSEELGGTLSNPLMTQVTRNLKRLESIAGKINTWKTDKGHAVLVHKDDDGVHALHLSAEIPKKFCIAGEALDKLLKALEPRGTHFFPETINETGNENLYPKEEIPINNYPIKQENLDLNLDSKS